MSVSKAQAVYVLFTPLRILVHLFPSTNAPSEYEHEPKDSKSRHPVSRKPSISQFVGGKIAYISRGYSSILYAEDGDSLRERPSQPNECVI